MERYKTIKKRGGKKLKGNKIKKSQQANFTKLQDILNMIFLIQESKIRIFFP